MCFLFLDSIHLPLAYLEVYFYSNKVFFPPSQSWNGFNFIFYEAHLSVVTLLMKDVFSLKSSENA